MKGLEEGSGKRLTTVMAEELGPAVRTAVWVGPGHVQDFISGMPNCMVIASADEDLTHFLVDTFTSPLIRFYYGQDLLGIEIGAAAKNVMGIAAGMLDGAHLTSLKGALMARGAHELSVLVAAMGGQAMTVYGLSHLAITKRPSFPCTAITAASARTSSKESPSKNWPKASARQRHSSTCL